MLERLLETIDEVYDWCLYRNEVIQGLMNKQLENLEENLAERVEEGKKLARFIDVQVAILKKGNRVRKSVALQKRKQIMEVIFGILGEIFIKVVSIIEKIVNYIGLGDLINALATIAVAIVGYKYTKVQDKKIENQNKIERLSKYQSIVAVDGENHSMIELKNEHREYRIIYCDKNVLFENNRTTIDTNYEIKFSIMLKNLNETLPSHVSIKQIVLIDKYRSKEGLQCLTLLFSNNNDDDNDNINYETLFLSDSNDNNNKDFNTLCYHNNKVLEMTCLCCMTESSFNRLSEIDSLSEKLEIEILFEVKNQFNIITEMNLRANFEIQEIEEENDSKYIKLNLLDEYSNITKTYEEQSY